MTRSMTRRRDANSVTHMTENVKNIDDVNVIDELDSRFVGKIPRIRPTEINARSNVS